MKKTNKPVSFDVMVKFFMQKYNIPTKSDIDRLEARMDRLEQLIVDNFAASQGKQLAGRSTRAKGRVPMTASDTVLEVIRTYKNGVGFADVQARTGYGEKKLRNIIFRLNNLGKIQRKSRGVYYVP